MRVFNLLKTRIEEMEENGDVDGLIHELNDDSEDVRREAIMALERIGDFRATEPLIQILQGHDITLKEETTTTLGKIQDKKAVPALIQNLNNQHIGIRKKSIEALGKIGDPQATEPLIQTLQDPDKTIQEEATTALGRIAVYPFINDLQNDDQKYRDNAIIALNHLGELKISEKVGIPNSEEIPLSEEGNQQDGHSDEILNKEVLMEDDLNQKSKGSDFDIKKKKLVKTGFNVYIENFVKNSCYNYLDGFNTKSRYDYEFADIRKLRDLIKYKGLEFSNEEVTLLIKEEIKNHEYKEFEEKILAQHPENLTDYIKILINTYTEPKTQTENLKKLLNEQNLKHHGKLTEEIEKTHKQLEIKNSKTN